METANQSKLGAFRKHQPPKHMAKGGMAKKCVTGGEITGPGGPTDDLVPIMASNGEFMIKAKSAKILGPEVLEALNDLGDEPKNPKDDAADDAKEEMKCGGMVRKMWSGGPVSFGDATDPNATQIPTGIQPDPQAPLPQPAQPMPPVDMQAAKTLADTEQARKLAIGASANSITSGFNIPMPQLKNGGMVRPVYMESGGDVEKRRAEMLAKIPSVGTAPAPDGASMGNDFTRNANNSLNALGGMGVVASVPLRAAAAVPSGLGAIQSSAMAAPMLANGVPGANFIAGVNSVRQVGGANLPTVIGNAAPISKTVNVALQEGAQANQFAAGTRSLGNASAGLGAMDAQQTLPATTAAQQATPGVAPVQSKPPEQPTTPSLNAPWYAPEYARAANASDLNGLGMERARRSTANPGDANDPLKNLMLNGTMGAPGATVAPGVAQAKPAAVAQLTSPAIAARPNNTQGKGYLDPRRTDVNPSSTALGASRNMTDELSGRPGGNLPQLPSDLREGVIHKTVDAQGRVTYSGRNVGTPGGGPVLMVDGLGKALKNQGSVEVAAPGSFSAGPGGYAFTPSAATPEGRGLQKQEWDNKVSGMNARDAATKAQSDYTRMIEDATAGLGKNHKAAFMQQLMQTQSQDKRYADSNAIAQGQFGLNRTKQESELAKDKRATDAQDAYANAKTPEEREAAKRTLVALGVMKTGTATYHPGSKVTDAMGNQTVTEGTVFNPETQEVRYVGPQGQQASKPTPKQGDVLDGHRFKGGNPADQKNWEKV